MRISNHRFLLILLTFSLLMMSCQLLNRAISQGGQPPIYNADPTQPARNENANPTPLAGSGVLKADSKPLPNGLVLASPEETQSLLQNKNTTYTAAPPESYSTDEFNKVGSTLRFTSQANNAKDVFPWLSAWCATTPKILAQNLTQMEQTLSVNGQAVDLSTVWQNEYSADGQTCHGYSLAIYGWPAGETIIEEKIIFKSAVNDGALDFPAGVMTRIFKVSLEHAESSLR